MIWLCGVAAVLEAITIFVGILNKIAWNEKG